MGIFNIIIWVVCLDLGGNRTS